MLFLSLVLNLLAVIASLILKPFIWMLRWQHEYVLMKSLLSNDLQQWLRHCFVSCFNHMNSEETTRAVTGRRIQMTVITFHREHESGAVFHISPTRFHVRIRKKKKEGEGARACALSSCCSKFHEFSEKEKKKKKKHAVHESHYTLRNRRWRRTFCNKEPELCTDVPQQDT